MSWCFPFGVGGTEEERESELSLTEWVRHCLNYHDDRFRKDPVFIFVVYKCLQVRSRVTLTNVLYQTTLKARGETITNEVSVDDFTYELDVLAGKKTLFDNHTPQVQQRVQGLLNNLKIGGRQSVDNIFTRDECPVKMMGLITSYNLPNPFITLNPSDIHNPIVSF